MSARKPRNYWPLAFVAALGVALLLSNQGAPSPRGGEAISNDLQYTSADKEGQRLSEGPLKKVDAHQPLTDQDKKDLNAAVVLYDKMTDFTPTISPLFFLSGKIHHVLGEDEIAEEKFRQCMLTFYHDAEARPQYVEGIRKTGAEASYQLARLLYLKPNKQDALDAADVAVHYIPQSSAYHSIRGMILNEMRKTDEAKKELNEALRLDPNNAEAKRTLDFISG